MYQNNAAMVLSTAGLPLCGLMAFAAVFWLMGPILSHEEDPDMELSMGDKLGGSMLQAGCIEWRDEQIKAILNLIVSFGLGIMMLVIVALFTSICYPRQQYTAESRQEQRVSKGFRLLTIGLMLRRFHVVSHESA